MKSFLILMACLLSVSWAAAGDLKVATVDLKALFKAYPGTAPAQKKFEAMAKKKKALLEESQGILKGLQKELGGKLTSDEKAAKQQEFQDEAQKFQEEQSRIQGELDERDSEITKALVVQIKAVVADVAKQDGVDLVLDSGDVASLPSGLDLTKELLEKFKTLKPAPLDLDSDN